MGLLVSVGVLIVVAVIFAVVVAMAVLIERFTTWAEADALERDERDISRGPSEWNAPRW